MTRTLLALALLAACTASPGARADTVACTRITSLPATLTSQGVYCLKGDLATSLASGAAITVAVNNVTIDCNGYKVGGLAGGSATNASGIVASGRLNTVVRNCNVRGFSTGIELEGFAHTIEDNRLDGNTRIGILVAGDGSLVRRNRVFDTGGAPGSVFPFVGIHTLGSVDIEANTVSGVVSSDGTDQMAIGIYTLDNPDGEVASNHVRAIIGNGSGIAMGIRAESSGALRLRGNQVVGLGTGIGIYCTSDEALAVGNHILGWPTWILTCEDVGGSNVVD